jgi:hypothetical protein
MENINKWGSKPLFTDAHDNITLVMEPRRNRPQRSPTAVATVKAINLARQF